jgi:catechol 2,3-dioxygenase-like lactoylglutathione lyase family enzyme
MFMTERARPRIVHVGFYCKDLSASVAWYVDVLGMDKQFGFPGRAQALGFGGDKEDHDIFLVQAPEQYAEPSPMHFDYQTLAPTKGRVGFYHVSIDLGSFAAAMHAYTRALERNSALAKSVQHGDGRGIYVRDPDGNLVELFSFNGCVDDEDALKYLVAYPGSEGRGGGYAIDMAATYAKWRAATQATLKEPAPA